MLAIGVFSSEVACVPLCVLRAGRGLLCGGAAFALGLAGAAAPLQLLLRPAGVRQALQPYGKCLGQLL